jgi:hypothetical protein
MKLPTNNKTRTQILILAGLVMIFLLILAYFALASVTETRAKTRISLASALLQLEKIDREIKSLPALRQSRDNLFWRIQQTSTNYILFHEYRNYHLTARETLLPLAAELGITIDIPKEGSVDLFPISEAKSTNKAARVSTTRGGDKEYGGPVSPVFALYPVTLSGRAGFPRLLSFLQRLETVNPYLTLSDFTIRADAQTPEEHDFSMTLYWPIWKNLELKPKVADLILPAKDYGNAPESN